MKCIKIIGNKINYFRFFGSQKTNEQIEMIIIKQDKKEVTINSEYCFSSNDNIPKLVNGRFTLKGINIWVNEIFECTKDEIGMLKLQIDKHNMYWGEISFQKYNLYGTQVRQIKYDTLLYKEKDLFPIVLNGERITYKEFKEKNIKGYFRTSGDNGYSYSWERSEKIERVYSLVDKIFRTEEEITFSEKCTAWWFALKKVHCGDYCGCNFDETGALILNVTATPIEPISEISNT